MSRGRYRRPANRLRSHKTPSFQRLQPTSRAHQARCRGPRVRFSPKQTRVLDGLRLGVEYRDSGVATLAMPPLVLVDCVTVAHSYIPSDAYVARSILSSAARHSGSRNTMLSSSRPNGSSRNSAQRDSVATVARCRHRSQCRRPASTLRDRRRVIPYLASQAPPACTPQQAR